MGNRANQQVLIEQSNLVEYFRGTIESALSNQSVAIEPETSHYLVNLLSHFSRAENLYEKEGRRRQLKPLALMYAEAANETSPKARYQALRRLGDVALFICGVFSNSLNRQVVDVDYYIAMGGSAYAYLSDGLQSSSMQTLAVVFSELSSKFTDCADVLAEVSEGEYTNSDRDVLRTYEVWLRTGSKRACRQLQTMGIEPPSANVSRLHH